MQTSGNVSDPSRLIIPDVLTHCEHYRCEPTSSLQVGFGRLSLHDQVHPFLYWRALHLASRRARAGMVESRGERSRTAEALRLVLCIVQLFAAELAKQPSSPISLSLSPPFQRGAPVW